MRLRSPKPTTVLCFVLAFLFCCVNGFLQMRALREVHVYPASWLVGPRFIVGCGLWAVGMAVNVHSDHILIHLRKPGERGYKVPRGGCFRWLSAPNFAGEILEWAGFAVACWSLEAAAFAVFTACNIGPRGLQHHRWYQTKFVDYPKDRAALIPFVL